MEYKDYYKILGVSKNASQAEIKKSYRKLAVKYHPDKTQGDVESEKKFKEANEAYEVIGDPEKRKKYDELGSNWKHYDQYKNAGYGSGQRQQQYQYRGDFSDMFGSGGQFSDFFNAFFGGAGRPGGSADFGGGTRGRTSRRAPDSTAVLPLSFYEAVQGVEKVVEIDGKKVKLKIKPGARNDQKLKLRGKGKGGGDLIITLRVADSKEYDVDGLNFFKKQKIDLFTALLGGKQAVQTPHGTVNLNIPEGAQSGQKFRLKGKGMSDYNNPSLKGDLTIELSIQVPQNLSAKEKELLNEWQKLRAN
ncbi:MAG: DnaJ C-terminal domain-containing protein [Cryomorphaceae bacterium]